MEDEISQTINENLIEHYIYIFGAPTTILSDQGQNFLSELMRHFEEAF